jgi:rhomboid protease GluP
VSEQERLRLVDRLVELLARVMNAFGLNGTRVLWKWNQRRKQIGESGLKGEILWRSTQGRHKMCPSCRALVPRSARVCSECGAGLGGVAAPGLGRLLSNVLPGAKTASSLILLANGFWFLMMLLAQMKAGGPSPDTLGLFRHFDSRMLLDFGSGASWLTLRGEWWRLVTPIFLHAGIIHFFFNSYVLLQLGPLAEVEFGTERFWSIYLACGIAGSATSQLLQPVLTARGGVNTIGASGAIMGLMGLLLVHGWRTGGARGESLKQQMLRYALYIVIFSLLVRGVDHFNHAGGFLCGAVLGAIVPATPLRRRAEIVLWQACALAGVLLVLYCFYRVAGS